MVHHGWWGRLDDFERWGMGVCAEGELVTYHGYAFAGRVWDEGVIGNCGAEKDGYLPVALKIIES